MAPPLADALTLLACPVCRGRLCLLSEAIACEACARVYPVRDGIPVLIAEVLVAGEAAVGDAVSHTETVRRDT